MKLGAQVITSGAQCRAARSRPQSPPPGLVTRADRRLAGPQEVCSSGQSREHLPLHLRPDPPHQRRFMASLSAQSHTQAGPPAALQPLFRRYDKGPCFRRFTACRSRAPSHLRTLGSRSSANPVPCCPPNSPERPLSRQRNACWPGSKRSIHDCARPSPSTTAPSSPSTSSWLSASACRPSSVILTAPGKRAPSRMPLAAYDGSCLAKPISTPSTTTLSMPASPPTTTPHENALGSRPRPRYFLLNCCTSNLNPHPRCARDDTVVVAGASSQSKP